MRSAALRAAWSRFQASKADLDVAHALATEICPTHPEPPRACDCRVKRLGEALSRLRTAYLGVVEAAR